MWDKTTTDTVVFQHRAQVKALKTFINQLQFDRERQKRLQWQLCAYCHYIPTKPSKIASTCLVCGTAVIGDRLCRDCAKERNLCVHCGGTLDMKIHKEDSV